MPRAPPPRPTAGRPPRGTLGSVVRRGGTGPGAPPRGMLGGVVPARCLLGAVVRRGGLRGRGAAKHAGSCSSPGHDGSCSPRRLRGGRGPRRGSPTRGRTSGGSAGPRGLAPARGWPGERGAAGLRQPGGRGGENGGARPSPPTHSLILRPCLSPSPHTPTRPLAPFPAETLCSRSPLDIWGRRLHPPPHTHSPGRGKGPF